jgi:hypothetical protein
MEQEIKSLSRELYAIGLASRVHHIPRTPEMPMPQHQTVCERGLYFVIPRRHRHWNWIALAQAQGQQGDEREQPQQDGGWYVRWPGPTTGVGSRS